METATLWQQCMNHLENTLAPDEFNIWVRPLQVKIEGDRLILLAPNAFVMERVKGDILTEVSRCIAELYPRSWR